MTISRRKLLQNASVLVGTTGISFNNASRDEGQDVRATPDTAADPIELLEIEPLARKRLTPAAWEYISSGAGDEISLRWNRESFDRLRLMPRALVDVSSLDLRVNLFGRELPHPILLAPTAYHRLVHNEGELETARGADAAQAIMVVSTMATTSVEEIAAQTKGPLWFQLYVHPDRGFTRNLVKRAEAAGCQALVLTVDTPVVGLRYREMRIKFSLPPGMDRPHLRGLPDVPTGHLPPGKTIYSALFDSKLTWKDIEWLRSFVRVPVLLKGILNPEDADLAVRSGVDGIIVSNHGARNLDTVPATIDVLPLIVERVKRSVPVLIDGGIRRGTDVLKALALGANAVLIGRPYLYGLGLMGSKGVILVIDILRRELETAMALTGNTSIKTISRSTIF
jgi:4-hydroxymandelate oxidase